MRLVVIIVAALTIVGVAALGLVLAQKGGTPTATAASTVRIASVTQEVCSPPVRQSVKLPKRRVPKRRPSFCWPTSTRKPAAQ